MRTGQVNKMSQRRANKVRGGSTNDSVRKLIKSLPKGTRLDK